MKRGIVEDIVGKRSGSKSGLIAMLQDIQEALGFLPEEALRVVAEMTGRPLIDIYRVATFYSSFRFKPKGKHLFQVCLGTACHVRGGNQLAKELSSRLGIEPGDTTADGEYSLESVNCLGCCAIGPVLVKDGKYHGQVKSADLDDLVEKPSKKVRNKSCRCEK